MLTTEPCPPLFGEPSLTPQPAESSLQASCAPVGLPLRTYSTVSKAVAPQVVSLAVPLVVGVQVSTRSGALPVWVAHVPLAALAPLVVPLTVPPRGGTTSAELGLKVAV